MEKPLSEQINTSQTYIELYWSN